TLTPCPVLARSLPSGLKATLASLKATLGFGPSAKTPLEKGREKSSLPVRASQTFTPPTPNSRVALAEARRLPSGLKAKPVTAVVCPLRLQSSWPVCASHTLTVPGSPPVGPALPAARSLPSGLKATLATELAPPFRIKGFPAWASQTFIP